MNLVLRVVSALVLLPVVLVLLHLGGWYTFGLCIVAGALTLREYAAIVAQGDNFAIASLTVLGTALCASGILIDNVALALVLMQFGAVLIALLFTLRTGEFDTAWSRMASLAFGLLYVSLPIVAIYRLRDLGQPLSSEWMRPSWVYVALIATWGNDTFAYFAGRTFGKHKMYPKVSPKKTWEGLAGGVIGSVALLFVLRFALPGTFGHFTWIDLLFIGLPSAFLGPVGDLAESLLKRNHGVKDSGRTIPGHGGLLDRLDALFFVAAWVLVYGVGVRPLLEGLL